MVLQYSDKPFERGIKGTKTKGKEKTNKL